MVRGVDVRPRVAAHREQRQVADVALRDAPGRLDLEHGIAGVDVHARPVRDGDVDHAPALRKRRVCDRGLVDGNFGRVLRQVGHVARLLHRSAPRDDAVAREEKHLRVGGRRRDRGRDAVRELARSR